MQTNTKDLLSLDDLRKITGLSRSTIVSRLFKNSIKAELITGTGKFRKAFYPKESLKVINYPLQLKRPLTSTMDSKKSQALNGISKRGNKFRINIGVNGKTYYLGKGDTLADSKKLRALALEHKAKGTFEDWYKKTYKTFETERIGKYFTLPEAADIVGLNGSSIYYYIQLLGIELLRKGKKNYLSLEDIEKIKGRMKKKGKGKERKASGKK